MVKSNYPFTEASTRQLTQGILLPRGIFLGCLLTPGTLEKVNYGWISRIYYDVDTGDGLIDVKTDDQKKLCTVRFSLNTRDSILVGEARDAGDTPCGCMTATNAIIPFFYADYTLAITSLIFTPSALRILNATPASAGKAVKYKGEEVTSLNARLEGYSSPEVTAPPYISSIVVNDTVTLKGSHVAITTDCGGIRVHKSGNDLKFGRFCDLND